MITKEWIDALYKDISINQTGRDPLVISAETFFKLAGAAMRSLNASADRWIPVSERLPEFPPEKKCGGAVLCTYERDGEHRKVAEMYFTCDGFFELGCCEFADPNWFDAGIRIIAWQYMPMPALPKEMEG